MDVRVLCVGWEGLYRGLYDSKQQNLPTIISLATLHEAYNIEFMLEHVSEVSDGGEVMNPCSVIRGTWP